MSEQNANPGATQPPMTVAQMIVWLQTKDPMAPVLLQDPDTDWLLPLRTDYLFPGGEVDPKPANAVVLYASYHE